MFRQQIDNRVGAKEAIQLKKNFCFLVIMFIGLFATSCRTRNEGGESDVKAEESKALSIPQFEVERAFILEVGVLVFARNSRIFWGDQNNLYELQVITNDGSEKLIKFTYMNLDHDLGIVIWSEETPKNMTFVFSHLNSLPETLDLPVMLMDEKQLKMFANRMSEGKVKVHSAAFYVGEVFKFQDSYLTLVSHVRLKGESPKFQKLYLSRNGTTTELPIIDIKTSGDRIESTTFTSTNGAYEHVLDVRGEHDDKGDIKEKHITLKFTPKNKAPTKLETVRYVQKFYSEARNAELVKLGIKIPPLQWVTPHDVLSKRN